MEPKKEIIIKDENQLDIKNMPIFENDSALLGVHKKLERIALATYMLTDFFSAEEPLKWALRKATTGAIKDITALGGAGISLKDSFVRNLTSHIVEISSLYEVAHAGGFISTMNFSIISKEMLKVATILEGRDSKKTSLKSVVFDDAFFATTESATSEKNTPKDTSWAPARTTVSAVSDTPIIRTHPAPQSHPAPKVVSSVKDNQKDVKDKRQQTILSLIKKHRSLTIKGFAGAIKGCSEKTVQRELLALVAKGVLKKEGERRWSTYSLA